MRSYNFLHLLPWAACYLAVAFVRWDIIWLPRLSLDFPSMSLEERFGYLFALVVASGVSVLPHMIIAHINKYRKSKET